MKSVEYFIPDRNEEPFVQSVQKSKRLGDVGVIRSKTQQIPGSLLDPYYTDERFTRSRGGRTIFLDSGLVAVKSEFGSEYVEGAHYNYSDRLSLGYGFDHVEAARDEAFEEIGNRNTAVFFEAFLQKVYNDPTALLQHIMAGVNASSGFSYKVFGTVSTLHPKEKQSFEDEDLSDLEDEQI